MDVNAITDFERELIATVGQATFPPATGAKRFIRDLKSGHITQLTENGRWFLAFIAHRFRRQYALRDDQWIWVNERLKTGRQAPTVKTK